MSAIAMQGPQRWTEQAFFQELALAWSRSWVVEEADVIVGFLVVWLVAGELQILNIATLAEKRRHGLGRMMIEYAKNYARENAAESITLEVRESNAPARALYETCGFTSIGRRPRYYADTGEDGILMRCTI